MTNINKVDNQELSERHAARALRFAMILVNGNSAQESP